jgi:hypothetical protein
MVSGPRWARSVVDAISTVIAAGEIWIFVARLCILFMSHQKHVLLITLGIVGVVALVGLAIVGGAMLWLMHKQPARWKALSDGFEDFLVARRLLPASVTRMFRRYDNPALEKILVWIGLVGIAAGCLMFIRDLSRILR